jgi:hypothetical protein
MYPDRSAGRQKAVVKGRQRCTMRLLTPGKRAGLSRTSPAANLVVAWPSVYWRLMDRGLSSAGCLLTCWKQHQLNLFINRYPRGSHVLELPPTHARTTHSPCTPHPRRSTKASIGILAPAHCPMRAILISVTKPKHLVSSKHTCILAGANPDVSLVFQVSRNAKDKSMSKPSIANTLRQSRTSVRNRFEICSPNHTIFT